MGYGNNGKKVMYRLEGLTRVDAATVGQKKLQQLPTPPNNGGRPGVDVDINNLIHIFGRTSVDPIAAAANHLKDWSQNGLVVTPVCDGDTRPVAKQATNQHRANRQKNKIKALLARQELRDVSKKLGDDRLNAEERDNLKKTRASLERKVKTAETQAMNVVPKDLPELLWKALVGISAHNCNPAGGRVAKPKIAEMQADKLMIGRYLSGAAQLLMSTDADMSGEGGDDCPTIYEFTGSKVSMQSTSKKTMEELISFLPAESKTKVKLVEAQYPIFEGIADPSLRALNGVIIGCDVSPGGVKGIGPQKLHEKLEQLRERGTESEESIYDEVLDFAVEASKPRKTAPPKYDKEVINTLVEAIRYEPTNEEGADRHTYVGEEPKVLPKYLEEFRAADTTIVEGPAMLECKGPLGDDTGRHNFLAAEDHFTCSKCRETVCGLCADSTEKKPFCLPCYLVESVLPDVGMDDLMPVAEMRNELKNKYKFDGAEKLSIDEVEDCWAAHALHRAIEDMASSVRFPVHPTSAIKSGEFWEELAEIDFSLGGSFLLNDEIHEKYIPAILELFASFIKFGDGRTKHTDWEKDGAVYSAMPEMFIDFAKNCRVDVGYRLLRRCLRHAMDIRTESLDNKTAKLILYEGQVGIHLTTPIPASMKKDVYNGDTILTKDKLLCAECDCKSGSKDEQRVACVHTLARAFLLTLLIAEDLGEHMLLELSSMVTSGDIETDTWDGDGIALMKESVLTLMNGCGDMSIAEEVADKSTLYQMLQSYRTGTQRRKEWGRVHKPPKGDEIGPIQDIIFDSPEQKAKVLLRRASAKASLDPTEEIVKFVPNYQQAGIVMNAAGINPSTYDFVGFRLFELRRKEQPFDLNTYPEKLSSAQTEWKTFLEGCEKRSTRRTATQLANINTPAATSPTTIQSHRVTPSPAKRKTRSQSALDEAPSPPKKTRVGGWRSGRAPNNSCAKNGCGVNSFSDIPGLSFHRVPPYPADPPDGASLNKLFAHKVKRELRCEVMDRIRGKRDDRQEHLKVCSCHPVEKKEVTISVEYEGQTHKRKYELTLIAGAGPKSSALPSTASKGVGHDRYRQTQLNALNDAIAKGASPLTVPSETPTGETELQRAKRQKVEAEHAKLVAEGEAAAAMLLAQQLAENDPMDTASAPMCPAVSDAAGLVPSNEKLSNTHPRHKALFKAVLVQTKSPPKKKKKVAKGKTTSAKGNASPKTDCPPDEEKVCSAKKPPKVRPSTMTDKEVKQRTGFRDLSNMFAYIIVICNGDFDRIRRRVTSLTPFEEWFLYLEWKYGKTNCRQQDMEEYWGIDKRHINRVKDSKAALDVAALTSWPRFAHYHEDMALRKREKWSKYDGYRTIMWDMTNISAVAFSDASLQRSTFSEYYGENCFKGGVFGQLSGWLGVEDLWGGGCSDTDYHDRSGYLDDQKKEQEEDLVGGEVLQFTNILDRGYRGKWAAWQKGRQMALQPPSAKSDMRFTGSQTIYAGCVARDRSGNERGVNVAKRSGLMQRGFKTGMSARRFNYAWRTWTFQANFMYKPVL